VSKRRDRPYQGGRSQYWVKAKNLKHPAISRVMERSRWPSHLEKTICTQLDSNRQARLISLLVNVTWFR
jgi:hypothetical protein